MTSTPDQGELRVGGVRDMIGGEESLISVQYEHKAAPSIAYSPIYTRVLTQVQLTSGHEPSSNPPIDVG